MITIPDTSQATAMPERCARTDEVAVCLRDHGHPGLCVSPEMSSYRFVHTEI